MNFNRYILKLALGAALAYAIGNTLHTTRINYILYGSILCIHPIAGDTIGYVVDKLKAAVLGATFGILLDTAFQGNTYVSLPFGLTTLMAGGYWFNIPKRVLIFSGIVSLMAVANPTYTLESSDYIRFRFWNIFIGSVVGMTVNIVLWPNEDTDKLAPAFAQAIASIGQLYDRVINDYWQGSFTANTQSRQQLRADIERQLGVIDSLLGNAKNELWSPFANNAPYQVFIARQESIESLYLLVADLGLALEGGDRDQPLPGLQAELETLIQSTRASFEKLSQVSAFPSSQANPLANLPMINQAINDRLSQLDANDNLTATLNPSEIKRLSALIYGLRAIASELNTAKLIGALRSRPLRDR